ncbi:hypothetical protein LH441_13720 [Laribacter hongkongensis]|nr:hypothetical protein [Laribacter hongkongensis]
MKVSLINKPGYTSKIILRNLNEFEFEIDLKFLPAIQKLTDLEKGNFDVVGDTIIWQCVKYVFVMD